jgi:RimJ/RimL family protein N-acetyltransferase
LAREDRILFLIASVDSELIGHIGFSSFDYDEKGCEVDAVLRGEKQGHPGIMTFALRSLLQWGLDELKLEEIQLRVFSDNQRAIDFYLRNGFQMRDILEPDHPALGRKYLAMQLDLEAWNHKNRYVGKQTSEEEQR